MWIKNEKLSWRTFLCWWFIFFVVVILLRFFPQRTLHVLNETCAKSFHFSSLSSTKLSFLLRLSQQTYDFLRMLEVCPETVASCYSMKGLCWRFVPMMGGMSQYGWIYPDNIRRAAYYEDLSYECWVSYFLCLFVAWIFNLDQDRCSAEWIPLCTQKQKAAKLSS